MDPYYAVIECTRKRETKRKMIMMLPPMWMLFPFQVRMNLHVIMEWTLQNLEDPSDNCLLLEVNILNMHAQGDSYLHP